MDAHQYRRLCENRRRWALRRVGDAGRQGTQSPVAAVLAAAARALRRRAAAEAAWRRIARADWLEAVSVEGVTGQVVVLATASPVVGHELRRCKIVLGRRMAELVPGVRQLRVVVHAGS